MLATENDARELLFIASIYTTVPNIRQMYLKLNIYIKFTNVGIVRF